MFFKKIFKTLKRALGFKRKPLRKKKKIRHLRRPSIKSRRPIRRKRSRKAAPKIRRKAKKKASPKKKLKSNLISAKPLGVVTHYFPKVNAAVIELKSPLTLGEPIWIKGKSTDFRQTVGSMQIDRKPIEKAKKGQEIGLEVFREVKPGDMIFPSKRS